VTDEPAGTDTGDDAGDDDPRAGAPGGDGDGDDFLPPASFPDDPERVACLRAAADDLRTRGADRASLLAAVLYRVSDLYDPEEPADTTPEGIYRNMRNILQVTERGTLARDHDGDPDSTASDAGAGRETDHGHEHD